MNVSKLIIFGVLQMCLQHTMFASLTTTSKTGDFLATLTGVVEATEGFQHLGQGIQEANIAQATMGHWVLG